MLASRPPLCTAVRRPATAACVSRPQARRAPPGPSPTPHSVKGADALPNLRVHVATVVVGATSPDSPHPGHKTRCGQISAAADNATPAATTVPPDAACLTCRQMRLRRSARQPHQLQRQPQSR